MSTNPTHRSRLARALADAPGTGIPYQKALELVTSAAGEGALPARLDQDGMREALRVLRERHGLTGPQGSALAPRYYRLAEITGGRLQQGVPQRAARAAAAGNLELTRWDEYDPAETVGELMADNDDPDLGSDWWQRVAAAGARPDCILPSPYPPDGLRDGYLPVDRALDDRERTGDVTGYHRALESIVRREPRDIDGWAHLGHYHLTLASPDRTPPPGAPWPDERQRRSWMRSALGHYQTAVSVAELVLPDPFAGILSWGHLDNRPFFRGLHGMALALWGLGRFGEAESVLLNMLWLNPMDNQGARELLANVRNRDRWEDIP